MRSADIYPIQVKCNVSSLVLTLLPPAKGTGRADRAATPVRGRVCVCYRCVCVISVCYRGVCVCVCACVCCKKRQTER